MTLREACAHWYSGAYLLKTVPCVLYTLMRHGGDPEQAIVGVAVGALHGRAGLPERWITGLSGRTAADDDGKMFQLLAAARQQ